MFGISSGKPPDTGPRLPVVAFDRKFVFAWVASLLIVGAVALLGYRSSAQLQGGMAGLEAAFREREALTHVSTWLLRMESAQLGYMISGNPADLRAFTEAARQLQMLRGSLDNPVAADLDDLWPLVDAKVGHMAKILDLAKVRPEAVVDFTPAGDGHLLMGRIDAAIAHHAVMLDARLTARRTEADRSLQDDVAVSAILTATLSVLLIFIQLLMVRERRARDALSGLHVAQQTALEYNVDARTRALREKAEQLRISESRFRSVFDSAPEAILSIGHDHRISVANPAAGRIFSCEPAQLIGLPLDELIPLRFRPEHGHAMRQFARQQGATRQMGRRAQVSGVRRTGIEFPAEATISSVKVGDESIYTVVLRDITDRLRAEAVLRDSEQWLRTVLEALPDAVLVNAQGRVSYVNSRAEALFGARAAEILGRDPLTLFRAEDHPVILRRLELLQQGAGVLPAVPLVVQAMDGRQVEVESSAALINEPQGWAAVVALRDLTHVRSIERELSDSRDRLRLLVHAQATTQETERRRIAMELHDDLQQSMAAIKMDIAAAMKALGDNAGGAGALLDSAARLTDAALHSTRRIVNDLRPQMLDDLGLEAALEAQVAAHRRRTGAETKFMCTGDFDEAALPENGAISLFRIAQEALNNAAKHSGACRVWVRLDVTERGVLLSVEDDGCGIADEDLGKLNAFGLHGMSERVAALGGRLEVKRRAQGGTQVSALIPVCPPSA